MAIAYFIPDQSKLLAAGSNGQSHHHHQQTNSGSMPAGSPPLTPHNGGNSGTNNNNQFQQQQQQHTQNHNFRANITIPLSTYVSAAPENVGCWDLVTQVFCYALRFCHETRLNPAVIEISFEFNGGLQQQTINSTTGTQAVNVGAGVETTITATTAPHTIAASEEAVGNASSNPVVPQTAVATVRVENHTSGTVTTQRPQVVTHQIAGRGGNHRSQRSTGRRSGAPRQN